ncbi:MAG: hypothetical protein RL095_2708 [Verrucomicrobiota bacterium]|jgi:hypothetical protein
MLEKLKDFDWSMIPGNEYYIPEHVTPAILGLAFPEKDKDVTSDARWALGNDHCGTYYPALIWALPFLNEILISGTEEGRNATIGYLFDGLRFWPEPETIQDETGAEVSVHELMKVPLESIRATLRNIDTPDARDLLEDIDKKYFAP